MTDVAQPGKQRRTARSRAASDGVLTLERSTASIPDTPATSYKPVGALIAGLAVLRYLANSPSPLSLTEITRNLSLNTSTCRNILRTLVDEHYLIYDSKAKLYAMGLGALELAGSAIAQGADIRTIRMVADEIAERENVTVTLWRRIRRDRMVLVTESLPAGNMSIKMNVGQRLPLLTGAAGRLMAAYSDLTEAEIEAQFRMIRLQREQGLREFMSEVEDARSRGWAIDDGRYTIGATSVAVPVLDGNGEALFAFSATMFSAQFAPARAEQLAIALRRPADLLLATLTYL